MWVWVFWRTVWRWAAPLACWLPLAAGAAVLEVRQVSASINLNGADTDLGVIALPYHWDHERPGASGSARFEARFVLPEQPAEPYGLLLYRVGNAYDIWLNGALLQRHGDLERGGRADYAKAPQYVLIPAQLLGRENVLGIHIRTDSGRRGGLTPPLIGPDMELQARYRHLLQWHLAGSLAIAIVSLVVGALALMLWLTQVDPSRTRGERRDNVYLYVGLAEWAWALRMGDKVIEYPPLPWAEWSALMALAVALWFGCMLMFCVTVAGWRSRPEVRMLRFGLWALFVIGGLASWLAVRYQQPALLTLWYGLVMAVDVPFSAIFVWAAGRPGASRAHRWLAAVLLFNVVVGLRDWLVFRFSETYDGVAWLRFSGLLFGLVLASVAVMRFRAASAQARELSVLLATRVAQREAELAQTYQRMEQFAREQERASERARIMRDMHDGVGSHISAAIRQLQSGRASQGEVLQTLRDSLDQLKLSIDAMHLPAGDVTALLANLRYRLEPRLQASGIELEWDVDLIDALPGLDSQAMRQLQFMVFEILSNVLQHAHASSLRMQARTHQAGALLRIADNGRGFDATLPFRKGLLSLCERAQAIGATVVVQSGGQGTSVDIALPGAEPAESRRFGLGAATRPAG